MAKILGGRALTVTLLAAVLSFVGITPASSFAANERAVESQNVRSIDKRVEVPASKVRIIPGSELNLVSRESLLPVKIRNDYPVAVRVLVHVEPVKYNLILASVIEQTIPANTTDTARVPISAISDGDVTVRAWIETFSGIPIGEPVRILLHVQAEIEGSVISIFAVLVLGLAVAGVIRTLRKRKNGGDSGGSGAGESGPSVGDSGNSRSRGPYRSRPSEVSTQ